MNALIAVSFMLLGGLASGAWYLPLNYVKKWSWESGWLVQGLMAWIIFPWLIAFLTIPSLLSIYGQAELSSIILPILMGLGWGIGGLTWGLSIRYLGIGLGNSLPLGITLSLATLIPVIFKGQWDFFQTINFVSVLVALMGVVFCGWAGSLKEKETKNNDNKASEFNLKKGLLFAIIGGVMSAFFAFGEEAGNEIFQIASTNNPGSVWNKNGVFSLILVGGFLSNFVYSIYLNFTNKTYKNYLAKDTSLLKNYLFSFLAGALWFSQFIFKGVATSVDISLQSISWSLLFTTTIIISNIIGVFTGEWKGVKPKTIVVLVSGLLILIGSVLIVFIAR